MGSVNVEADGDARVVSVSYLLASAAVPDASETDEPADLPEPGPAEEPADAPTVVAAQTLLLGADDLPERDWLAVLSPSLVDEFSEATAVLFVTESCRAVSGQVEDEDLLGHTALDLDTRSFRTGSGFDFARILMGVSVFPTEAEAIATARTAQSFIDGPLQLCFASGVTEAQNAAAQDGVPLQTSLGAAAISLQDAHSLQGHAEGGAAGIFVIVDLQVHSFQRGNVVGLVSTVISGDQALVDEIPQILCSFEARILGTSPGDCDLSLAAVGGGGVEANTDSDDAAVSTDPTSDDSAGEGGRLALAPVPPALIYPTGAGGWFAEKVPEGTRFVAGFNVPDDSVDDILNFYQAAFASLGAGTVTARDVTPASGFLEAKGASGQGTIQVIGTPSSTKAIQGAFVQFD